MLDPRTDNKFLPPLRRPTTRVATLPTFSEVLCTLLLIPMFYCFIVIFFCL